MLVINIINVVVASVILRYVHELDASKCGCALLAWQHRFIKYVSPIVIIANLIKIFVNQDPREFIKSCQENKALATVTSVYLVLGLLYSINLVLYFLKLRYSNCECARNWKQLGLLYPALIFSVILVISTTANILLLFGVLEPVLKKLGVPVPKKSELNNSAKNVKKTVNNKSVNNKSVNNKSVNNKSAKK